MLKGRQRLVSLRSVFTWFVCLYVLTPRQTRGQVCSTESVRLVKDLIEEVKEMKSFDCRLYTPTLDDYQQKCPSATLTCFAKEARVLTMEWTNKTSLPSVPLGRRLRKLIKQEDRAGCRQCEVHTEEAAETFLTALCNVLERMNAEMCPTNRRKRRRKRRIQQTSL